MSGRLIDADKVLKTFWDIFYPPTGREFALFNKFREEVVSGRLDAQSPTPGQDGLERIPLNVTFALEYLQGYMGDEPEEARSKLATLAKFINGLVPPSPTSTGERE